MDPAHSLSRPILAGLVIASSGLLLLLGLTDASSGLWPKCLFHTLTGLDCPGCGAQRAVHALFKGDILAAWHFNPLIFILAPVIALMLVCSAFPRRTAPLAARLNSRPAALILLFILVIWTILRNFAL